jgi:hypothetical protein
MDSIAIGNEKRAGVLKFRYKDCTLIEKKDDARSFANQEWTESMDGMIPS